MAEADKGPLKVMVYVFNMEFIDKKQRGKFRLQIQINLA